MTVTKYVCSRILTILWLLLFLVTLTNAQTNITSTATPISIETMFGCEQPCWHDIYIGKTTATELEEFMSIYGEGNYIAQVSEITNGSTSLRYGVWNRTDRIASAGHNVSFWLQDGIVIALHMTMNEPILVGEILSELGTPTEVRMHLGQYDLITVDLIYLDYLLEIRVRQAYGTTCSLETIGDDLIVDTLTYFTPQSAFELIDGFVEGVIIKDSQPRILNYSNLEWHVPIELWEEWLSGDMQGSCTDALWNLSREVYIPLTPTPLPTITATEGD
jgi:hypothetical protein